MPKAYHARVTSTGMCLPKTAYTNDDIIDRIKQATKGQHDIPELNAQWIEDNIWIKTRYKFSEEETLVNTSITAMSQALEKANWSPGDLDFIIFASSSVWGEANSSVIPSTACKIQQNLGAYNAFAYDMMAACSGWVYGMAQAVSFIESGMCRRGALLCCEKQDIGLDYTDHRSCVLIGDVSTATLLEYAEEPHIRSVHLQANNDKRLANIIRLPYPSINPDNSVKPGYFSLDGRKVFKEGIVTMQQLTLDLLEENNLTVDDVDWFIYHQANGAMLKKIGNNLGFNGEKNLMNIQQLGNTTAATIPSVLHMHIDDGTIQRGDTLSCVAFGGGLTAGRLLLTY